MRTAFAIWLFWLGLDPIARPGVVHPMNTTILEHPTDSLEERFRDMIADRDFPCVGAKSAAARDALLVMTACDITSAWNDLEIIAALQDWSRRYRDDPTGLRSFAVIFAGPTRLDEITFERAMWDRLQSIADKDAWLGQPFDQRVSPDPEDPHFCLSFGGEAYFVVGLHPAASRPARRFVRPALVFNLHDQFERLRNDGRYERMRERIMERDVALAGSGNPMLERHGDASAAPQYSGREVGEEWRCPFRDPRA